MQMKICEICGNDDLSEIEVRIEESRVTFKTFKANDLKNPIKVDDDVPEHIVKSIEAAKCTKCENEFDGDELDELSKEIGVSVF